jgi:hypothetical protein
VLNFVEIIRPITNMLKKYVDIKWSNEARSSFHRINKAPIEAHVLVSLDYSKEFTIFSFSSEENIVVVLLQKNDQGHENHIYLFNKALKEDEMKYDILEKHAYALVKALKASRIYIVQSSIKAYVSSNSVKEILFHLRNEGKRGKWIVKILEYELHINPTNIIKGRGLEELLSDSSYKELELHHRFNQLDTPMMQVGKGTMQVLDQCSLSPWYIYIVYFL